MRDQMSTKPPSHKNKYLIKDDFGDSQDLLGKDQCDIEGTD